MQSCEPFSWVQALHKYETLLLEHPGCIITLAFFLSGYHAALMHAGSFSAFCAEFHLAGDKDVGHGGRADAELMRRRVVL